MAERDGLLKRLGRGFDRYVGGLLGEDLATMTPEERAAARRSAIGIIGRGMVSPEGGSAALTNVMQARAMQRERPMRERAMQDIQQAQAAIAARLGAGGVTSIGGKAYGVGPDVGEQRQLDEVRPLSGYNLPALLASPAGAAALEMNPQLAEMVKGRIGQQVVGGSIYDRETGRFITPPEAPKLTDDMRGYQVAVAQGYPGSFIDYQKLIKGAGASRIVLPGQEGEKEYEKIAGKTRFESQDAAYKAAQAAVDNLSKVYDTLNILESGQPFTGVLAETELSIARLKQKLAGREDKRITDTEVLDALLGSEVFAQLSALGIGARGLDTPAEREFLREVVTGTKSLNTETIKKMTEIRGNVSNRIIDRYNQRVEKGELDNYFKSMGIQKTTIEKPQRPQAQTVREGTRAVSLDGRTTAVFKNGRWVDERTGQPIGVR